MDANAVIFTSKRRDLLARTIMDLAKIMLAAALASGFFGQLTLWWLRALLLGTIWLLLGGGLLICPRQEDRKEG